MNWCECCGMHNNHQSLDEKYKFACLYCVKAGYAAQCEYSGEWHAIKNCRCGRSGPANYFGWSTPEYYCGGSPSCCP